MTRGLENRYSRCFHKAEEGIRLPHPQQSMSLISSGFHLLWLGGRAIPQGRYDVMKIDKYYIKRAYSNNRFREVRAKVNNFLDKDYDLVYIKNNSVLSRTRGQKRHKISLI